ncbi:transposase IS3/IS911 [Candidatus Desulforudis audaxviator MP104C]|uniref:Transposase IS3/IS911 n=1 Tax=Desulforudis audaxviator (strain MP104C) TaxID=477974 RepID=B1I2Q3_DESAP|nr:transposase IS3/IS911 [Candidatus Desulforudis audaxviator MP104C]
MELMDKRKQLTSEQKAKIVLELLRGERTVAEIASEYEVYPTQLHRWKAEAIENLPSLFTRGASETEKMRRRYETE